MKASSVVFVVGVAIVLAGALCSAQICRAPPEPCTVNATGASFMRPSFTAVSSDPSHEFKGCYDLFHTNFCVQWKDTEDPNQEFMNVTIVITVDHVPVHSIHTTWPDLYTGDGVCLDDATVIEILMLVPGLQGSLTILQDILQVVGCIPSGLFSVCFQGAGEPGDHCLRMTYDLLYFENYCVLAGALDLGCHL